MKTRSQIYSGEALSILRDLSTYHCMARGQLLRMHPGKENKVDRLISYLARQKRIREDGAYCYAVSEDEDAKDKKVIAALWVLVDFIDRVDFHAAGNFPAQVIFLANDEIYEIAYVEKGREALVSQLLAEKNAKDSLFIVVVESEEQIAMLGGGNIVGYCTVSEDGQVKYYQKEEGE